MSHERLQTSIIMSNCPDELQRLANDYADATQKYIESHEKVVAAQKPLVAAEESAWRAAYKRSRSMLAILDFDAEAGVRKIRGIEEHIGP